MLAAEIAEHCERGANPGFVIEEGGIFKSQIRTTAAETHGALGRLLIVEDAFRFEAIHRFPQNSKSETRNSNKGPILGFLSDFDFRISCLLQ
jgi:hypothetical protein